MRPAVAHKTQWGGLAAERATGCTACNLANVLRLHVLLLLAVLAALGVLLWRNAAPDSGENARLRAQIAQLQLKLRAFEPLEKRVASVEARMTAAQGTRDAQSLDAGQSRRQPPCR